MNNKTAAFERILTIMNELREQCPWDKKQTIETLRPLTIEETYELSDVILRNDWKGIKEELGDILLHVVFYARIGEEQAEFDIADIINTLCDKLIARHPHIYGDITVKDDEEVKKNWEMLKLKEGKRTVLGGVPSSLPALIKAYRIQDKAAQVKFEWENIEDVWKKVEEEKQELREAVSDGDPLKIEEEFGDLLFAMVNYSRFLKVDAEAALERTNIKFMRRFNFIEERANASGKALSSMTLEEMDAIWNEAKQIGL
ncbi:MAG: nucleoside triphosphate pyrophosphohydrolase [Bacteroidetes bacterium]|nr:nucleoside triphosphate pyrophosphohydrolase [Bacteroidota bacterium]MBK8657736.1 nucleoside triphosphate pyrophosphohydrolase [Bacteroidota bacterium]